jgi:NAD(P)-dependent dehydrogenase (short-subunit alcohol dehydrogenase family)
MRNCQGKVAFITGGATGIGFGIAQAFAEAGMRVIIGSRNRQSLEVAADALTRECSSPLRTIQIDVTDRASVRSAAQLANDQFGRIDVLCNNAGVNLLGNMDEATYDDWDWILGVNLGGVINCLVSFLPYIKAHGDGGHIVNVASMASFIPGAGAGVYTTTKAAVRGLSECLRLNLGKYRIGVSLVCPGLTRSKIYEAVRHRPRSLRNTGFHVTDEQIERLASFHEAGKDALEVGRITLEAVRANRFYVFPHSEFRDEVAEDAREVLNAFTDEPADPQRLPIEAMRRRMRAEALQVANAVE